jgi:hypothetical protein
MSMKNKLSMLAFAALALSSGSNFGVTNVPEETDEEKKQRLAKAEIEKNKANGLKEFSYGENSLWALNKKSADNKARKRNWI